jgi:hypothetical protein
MGGDDYPFIRLLGREIPNWFSHKGIGSLISFHAPSISNGQFLWLLVSAVYPFDEETYWILDDPNLFIINKTRGNLKSLRPISHEATLCSFPEYFNSEFLYLENDHVFLCLMPLIRNQYKLEGRVIFNELFMESGDEIEVSVIPCGKANATKCGVHLLVAEPNVK